jgi:hypothetical protein
MASGVLYGKLVSFFCDSVSAPVHAVRIRVLASKLPAFSTQHPWLWKTFMFRGPINVPKTISFGKRSAMF